MAKSRWSLNRLALAILGGEAIAGPSTKGRAASKQGSRKPPAPRESFVLRVRCELCGKAVEEVRESPCCGRRLCLRGDVIISKQCCWVRHSRYTLCGHHSSEGHGGRWQTCRKCRRDFETELYVYYGTNRHNLEKLANPPAFEPKRCARCGVLIRLGRDAWTQLRDGSYCCGNCWDDD